jgi:hypothetical protein
MNKVYCNKSITLGYFASPERKATQHIRPINWSGLILFEAGEIYDFEWKYFNDDPIAGRRCADVFSKKSFPGSSFSFFDLEFFYENFKTIKELRKEKLQKINEKYKV